jgi:hypothetical protein
MTSFKDHLENSKSLPGASDEDLRKEQEKRASSNVFPLEVFNEKLQPLITLMHTKIDTPRCYIGLAIIGSYSSAIGTAYVVKNSIGEVPVTVWSCFTGISSSGKSTALKYGYKPLLELQKEYDQEWAQTHTGSDEDRKNMKLKTVLFRDIHIPTLIRDVFPDNPKGLTKHSDELLEWINGLNSYSKKESTDEQFWLSSWNGLPYSGMRSGKNKFSIEKTFCNIYGGIQPTLLKELFKNNRGTSGFIFRLLFTNPHESRISDPVTNFEIPEAFELIHKNAIKKLYIDKPVNSHYERPSICVINEEANYLFNKWCKLKTISINKMEDVKEREIASSIYGKIKEYSLRFAGILHLMDKALDENSYLDSKEEITGHTMIRALQLSDYFYQSAEDTYTYVDQTKTVPPEVLIMANLYKRGLSWAKIAYHLYGNESEANKSKARRTFNKYIIEFPKQFNSEA